MIRLENVEYKVKNKNIIKNINLSFEPGEMVFITGSSGAGKTSLLNLLGGIDYVSGGKMYYEESDITADIDEYRSKNVGFVFQNYNLISGMSALDNIRVAVDFASLKEDDAIKEEMQRWNIKDVDQKSESMSGGEKQRIAILRAMLKESRVILGDEPTGNLDPDNSDMVCRELKKLKQGRYIIIVTHNIDLAKKYADRIITIEDGCVVSDIRNIGEKTVADQISEHKKKNKHGHLKADIIVIKTGLKRRWWKLFLMALVVAFSLAVLLMGIALSKYNRLNMEKLNLDYLEADMINVRNMDYSIGGLMQRSGFFDETIRTIESCGIKETVRIYTETLNCQFILDGDVKSGEVKRINIDDFFEKRIMNGGVTGSFLKDKNDIIIASDIARKYFGDDDCIGKKIYILDDFDIKTEYNIVGVNNVRDINDKIKSYISAESEEDVLAECMKITWCTAIALEKDEQIPTPKIASGTIMTVSDDLKLIKGRMPESDDEVLVNLCAIAHSMKMDPDDVDVEEWYDKYAEKEYAAIINGKFKVKVVGVVEAVEERRTGIYFTKSALENLSKTRPCMLQVYVTDINDIDKVCDSLRNIGDLYVSIDNENAKDMILDQNKDSDKIIAVLGVTIVAIACMILISFILISVMARKRDMGIVKSLGARGMDLFAILISDAVVLCVCICGLSVLFTRIMIARVPGFLKGYKEFVFSFPTKEYLICMGIMTAFISFAFIISSVIYAFKKCSALLKEI